MTSVLAAQRSDDSILADALRAAFERNRYEGDVYNPDANLFGKAAERITALSADLTEACHDRDRYQADAERLRETAG